MSVTAFALRVCKVNRTETTHKKMAYTSNLHVSEALFYAFTILIF